GVTNASGVVRRSTDGVWAGFGPFAPSHLSLNWRGDSGRSFRVSVGVGDLFNERGTTLRQPVELYYQLPARGGTLTAGKFFVPYGGFEWLYESRWGVMYQGRAGRADYAAAVVFNPVWRSANAYARVGRSWGGRTSLGVSASVGRGMMYSTSHGMAFGMDLGHDFGGVALNAEWNVAHGQNGPFLFGFGRLALNRLGNFTPYVGFYTWGDRAGELGNFRSLLAGLNVRLNRFLALEGAFARAGGRDVFWVQSHLNF
ncbi:MAG: hypothetical protein NZ557_13770, partial [Chthonomonadaceae bacterium]|nr:hypothetical protein [Chthonomonadaceae bacterium]